MQGGQSSPAMWQNSMNPSEGNSTLGTPPVERGKGEQNVPELNCANEGAGSVPPSTAACSDTAALLRDAAQQSNLRDEMTAGHLTAAVSCRGSLYIPVEHNCTRAESTMAASTMLEGSAPTALLPAQPSSPEHDSLQSEADLFQQMEASFTREQLLASCPAAGESPAEVPDDAQLHVIPSAAGLNQFESSSSNGSPSAPSSRVAASMSTPKAGISDRSGPAIQHALPYLPESRHSKGLQQLWNSVAHTPLTVPSPCSMAGKHSKLDTRQCEEQGHQSVLMPEMATHAEGISQRIVSTVSSSAASGLTESATAHSAGSRSMPVGGAESPHR